jgi:hypothetical protein
MKENYEIGEKIELPKNSVRQIKAYVAQINGYKSTITDLSTAIHLTKSDMWETIYKVFPELKNKYEFNVQEIAGEVSLIVSGVLNSDTNPETSVATKAK